MPHTDFAARQRSKNPSVKSSFFDQSAFTQRRRPQLAHAAGPRGVLPERDLKGGTTAPPARLPAQALEELLKGFGTQPRAQLPVQMPVAGALPPPSLEELIAGFGTLPVLGEDRFVDIGDIFRAGQGAPGGGALGPTADAARLLSGAVAGNPFISAEGQTRLQGGQAPLLNQITPSFFRQTSPVIQQALLGLFQSLGLRPEDVSFTMEQFRPRGFSR